MNPYDMIIENTKKTINCNKEYNDLSTLRKTTKLLLFENISKIIKDKYLALTRDKNELKEANIKDFEINKIQFVEKISEKIENNLNEYFKDNKEKYIRKAKSIISNLRLNEELYNELLDEKITTEELVKMEDKVKIICLFINKF